MTVYTPRGLKIRIDVPYAFGLMARLYPTVSPFRVLKTAEGLQSTGRLLAFVVGVTAFGLGLSPLETLVLVSGASFVGALLGVFGIVIPGLVWLSVMYSYVSGFGVLLAVLLVTGFLTVGWPGVLAFMAGSAVGALASMVVELWRTRRYMHTIGHPLTSAEVSFFNAYRMHASKMGVTTCINLDDEESSAESWRPALDDLVARWPSVAQRLAS
jgi:hypothetical protein